MLVQGRPVERAAVLTWESRRSASVRTILGLPPSNASPDEQRRELLARKLEIGHDGLRALLGRRLWWSERLTRLSVAAARAGVGSASVKS